MRLFRKKDSGSVRPAEAGQAAPAGRFGDLARRPGKIAAPARVASEKSRRRLGPPGWVAITLGLSALGCMGLDVLHKQVMARPPYADTLAQVRLGELPRWMPVDIARGLGNNLQAAAKGRAIIDPDLVEDVYHAAGRNPWIARVRQVSKFADGSVLVLADYRRPCALVASAELGPNELRVVDRDGVVLPLSLRRLDSGGYVVIRGVASRPPRPGARWAAPDLADGLKLLALVRDKPYVSQISVIDVRNHDGRLPGEPNIRLRAQNAQGASTDIRFGRFPADDGLDVCVSPRRKLECLDWYARGNGGRLTGKNGFIDLRYDQLHVSFH